MSKTVLLTGISGFAGSHIMEEILVSTDWDIIGIASWKHKGEPRRIIDSVHYKDNKKRVRIITHDLRSPFTEITKKDIGKIDYIINNASESHVDRSISSPVDFIKNNVDLVLNILELTREVKPEKLIQISTDEVHGPMYKNTPHFEWDAHIPSNPYAASKACQEDIAISYWRTYGIPLIITNTMNLVGERQDSEKFIPKVIKALLMGEEITIHGSNDGQSGERFWIHARNQANALVYLLNNVSPIYYPDVNLPERFNVVGQRLSNLDMAKTIAKLMNKQLKYEVVNFHESRPGHDLVYGLDGSKMDFIGWNAPLTLEDSLHKVINWYMNHQEWL